MEVIRSMIKFIPHDYQKVAGDFILANSKCGLFLDMGLWQDSNYLHSIRYVNQ